MEKYIESEAGKSGFVLTRQDMFGRYAKIAYGNKRYGSTPGVQDYRIYRVIQRFRSNSYCDVPLTYRTEHDCYTHDEVVDVIKVIHCGIDESRVIRVALKDAEILPSADVVPVVRCRACRYYKSVSTPSGEIKACVKRADEENGEYYGFKDYTSEDWYCADGVKHNE